MCDTRLKSYRDWGPFERTESEKEVRRGGVSDARIEERDPFPAVRTAEEKRELLRHENRGD